MSERVIAVSGGFDPAHVGHIRMFQAAKELGDKLVIILNNDNWLLKKKGFVFMGEDERKEMLEALEAVDEVIISTHPEDPDDMSVGDDLEKLHPDVFANGGDRKVDDDDIPPKEYTVAEKLGFELVFNVGHGGKVQSSSDLVKAAKKHEK